MIPGALVALVICRGLGLPNEICGRVAAFGAVGIGFGGQETYGQTVRFVTDAGPMFWRGVVGLGVKGAVWGFLGGAVIGISCIGGRMTRRQLLIALGLLVAGTWLGWRVVDQPKLLYFSNLADRPRAEIWAGLIAGAVGSLGWLGFVLGANARVPVALALLGAAGGGIGFAVGGVCYAGGMALGLPADWYPGWKQMEFTFGLLLGAALGGAAWWQRESIMAAGPDSLSKRKIIRPPWWPTLSAALAAGLILGGSALPLRFGFTVAGAALLALASVSESAAWQIAVTVTTGAFFLDVGKFFSETHPAMQPVMATVGALALAGGLSLAVATRHASGRDMTGLSLRALLWMAVLAAMVRVAWHPKIPPSLIIVAAAFVGGGVLITILARSRK
ncbi:MAG: hypothetical protein EXS37_15600 [Opitutus sp.]|nr:hypothetical protein [Opitutus sp.]